MIPFFFFVILWFIGFVPSIIFRCRNISLPDLFLSHVMGKHAAWTRIAMPLVIPELISALPAPVPDPSAGLPGLEDHHGGGTRRQEQGLPPDTGKSRSIPIYFFLCLVVCLFHHRFPNSFCRLHPFLFRLLNLWGLL